jgi:hypothetical protein
MPGYLIVTMVSKGVTLPVPNLGAGLQKRFEDHYDNEKEDDRSLALALLDLDHSGMETQILAPLREELDGYKTGLKLPLTVFICSKLYDTVGSPVEYYLPISGAAMFLSFFFGFSKFLALGWLVAILMDSRNPSKPEGKDGAAPVPSPGPAEGA